MLFISVTILIYSILIIFLLSARIKQDNISSDNKKTCTDHISVIIPFRNEEQNLLSIIDALKKQTFKSAEYLLINDKSTDFGPEICNAAITGLPQFKLLHLPDNMGGKKAAIHYGVLQSKYNIIVQTDADCIPQPDWLLNYSQAFLKPNTSLVIAPVIAQSTANGSFFQKMVALEFLSLTGVTIASAVLKSPLLCNGANMGYLKNIYMAYFKNGYNKTVSGDDMFLLMYAKNRKYNIAIITNKQGTVSTQLPENTFTFLNQRKRWTSKSLHTNNLEILSVSVLVFISNILIPVALFLTLQNGLLLIPVVIKYMVDFLFLLKYSVFYNQGYLLKYYPIWIIIYPFYVLLATAGGILGSFTWKNRSNTV